MLQITIPSIEQWDEQKKEFVYTKEQILQLEHSLVAISKWESKWCKPFLEKDSKTHEEIIDYIRCMTITQNIDLDIDLDIYKIIPDHILKQIDEHIKAPMTATWFNEIDNGSKSKEIVTSEVIYYRMIALNIPMECQKWHINRLLTLIRVCSIKNSPPKKIGKKEAISKRKALNEARKQKLNTKG